MELDLKQRLISIKKDLEFKAELEYQKQFIELTGLKVGDMVECSFNHSHGDRRNSYITSSVGKGILKQNKESGYLYVESINKYKVSKSVSNNRSGSSYRSWWEYELTLIKSDIIKIKNLNKL